MRPNLGAASAVRLLADSLRASCCLGRCEAGHPSRPGDRDPDGKSRSRMLSQSLSTRREGCPGPAVD